MIVDPFEKRILFFIVIITIGVGAFGGVVFVCYRFFRGRGRPNAVSQDEGSLQQTVNDEQDPFQDAFSEDEALVGEL